MAATNNKHPGYTTVPLSTDTSYSPRRPLSISNNNSYTTAPVITSLPFETSNNKARSSVSELAKAFEAPAASRFNPPSISSRSSSPTRALHPPPAVPIPQPPSSSSNHQTHPGLPSLQSFRQYQAQMQYSQDTSYSGGHDNSHMSYEEGQRRMAEYRTHSAASSRSRQPPYGQPANLIPVPPPHAYAQSGRSAESSPERGYSPARSYRDERSPSPSKMQAQQRPGVPHSQSYSSTNNLLGAAAVPGISAMANDRSNGRISHQAGYLDTRPGSLYRDSGSDMGSSYSPSVLTPNNAASAGLGTIDPMEIIDDDMDDPILNKKKPASGYGNSLLGFGNNTSTSALYNSIPGAEKPAGAARFTRPPPRKQNKTFKAVFWGLAVFVVIGIVAGVVAFVLVSQKNNNKDLGAEGGTYAGLFGSSSSDNSTSSSSSTGNSDLTKSSPEIIALMNNKDLHKVFPGIDYTPQNAQWPACLTNPPSQDNVTKDIAIISQLAPAVRLYGTDCNQTELVLTAISALGLEDSLKLWAAVWLENNSTTNDRQLSQMYNVLASHGTSQLAGVIIGNEVLYRKDMTESQLIGNISDFRSNVTTLYPAANSLKVGTSDLGSSWTPTLATAVDVVMSNIHPFFGGVPAAQAAAWTWDFFQTNDVPVSAGMTGKQQIIAETGWPSGGGNDCGSDAACASDTDGAVAGIDEMNTFMGEWVCGALANGTEYFWFEIFDEPWKYTYNTPTQQWETQWGLMDANRVLKPNVNIPSCGGKTAS